MLCEALKYNSTITLLNLAGGAGNEYETVIDAFKRTLKHDQTTGLAVKSRNKWKISMVTGCASTYFVADLTNASSKYDGYNFRRRDRYDQENKK